MTTPLLLTLSLLAAPAAAARAPQEPSPSPLDTARVLEEVDFEQHLGDEVPLDLEFTDHTGRPVRLGGLAGDRPVLLALVYYECPMLCTMVLNDVLRCVKTIPLDVGEDYRVVAVSVDPDEGPELAAAKRETYVKAYGREGSEDGWSFLVGEQEEIRALADAIGFRYRYDPETDEYAHAAGITLLTPEGRISRYFYGLEYPPRDVRLGLVEASEGTIGSAVDHVLLFCYSYDPTTGKYGLVVMNVVRAGGALTVAVLAAFVILMLRRDRREKHRGMRPAEGRA